MKNTIFGALVAVLCSCLIFSLPEIAAQPAPALRLTQLSSREWVDLSKVSMVRLPVYTTPSYACPECQTRWGADFVIDGVSVAYSEEAEVTLRKLLGAK